MKTQKCPFCGSTRTTRSPSGEHLLCLGCQRILVVPRTKGPRDHEQETKDAAESEAKSAADSAVGS